MGEGAGSPGRGGGREDGAVQSLPGTAVRRPPPPERGTEGAAIAAVAP